MSKRVSLLMLVVAQQLLDEHAELKNFLSGFGPKQVCECAGCIAARQVLDEVPRG